MRFYVSVGDATARGDTGPWLTFAIDQIPTRPRRDHRHREGVAAIAAGRVPRRKGATAREGRQGQGEGTGQGEGAGSRRVRGRPGCSLWSLSMRAGAVGTGFRTDGKLWCYGWRRGFEYGFGPGAAVDISLSAKVLCRYSKLAGQRAGERCYGFKVFRRGSATSAARRRDFPAQNHGGYAHGFWRRGVAVAVQKPSPSPNCDAMQCCRRIILLRNTCTIQGTIQA